jgi:uncharacterized Zn finger protein
MPSEVKYECPSCEATGALPACVVDLCKEHEKDCEECGQRMNFNLAGKKA